MGQSATLLLKACLALACVPLRRMIVALRRENPIRHLIPILMQVSARNWDHNDKFPQFNGPHATLPQGYQVLFQRLADQLDVHYRTPVTRVEVTEGGGAEPCRVTDSLGEVWLADKVSGDSVSACELV